jgi:hypothetical protein
MALSQNPAVVKAYDEGYYTDGEGNEWRRGMDGWFLDFGANGRCLSYHHHFVEKIEKENPVAESSV